MSFVATFEDGPMNGPRPRTFMAASVPERMWFAPERRVVDRKTVTHDGWMLVGTAPGAEPAEAWPGQIEFVLDPERSNVNLGAPGRIGSRSCTCSTMPDDPPAPRRPTACRSRSG